MREGQFSRTALSVANLRAAHQILEGGSIFRDALAAPILGAEFEAPAGDSAERRPLRLFVALRSRIAEEVALKALKAGARQVVVLGAGLDTFGCRLQPAPDARVFEVDHPATQVEKRRRLAAAGIEIPAHLVFAPCDFERQRLADALASAGFDPAARTAFTWLGVTPYLTPEAFEATLRHVAGLPGGADIVFDYANPTDAAAAPEHRAWRERMARRVEAVGERFLGHWETGALHALLHGLGFAGFTDLGPREIAARLRPGGPPGPENGGHILHAWTRADGGPIASLARRATVDPE